jgi:hypothetical protein
MTLLAASGSYPFLDVMWTIFLFFGLVMFFWLLFMVFGDLFRRHDIGGLGKTLWTVFILVLPLIGAFTYLIAEGRAMGDRNAEQAKAMKAQTDDYIRSVATGNAYHGVDEIARGQELLKNGAISQDEFDEIKKRALV